MVWTITLTRTCDLWAACKLHVVYSIKLLWGYSTQTQQGLLGHLNPFIWEETRKQRLPVTTQPNLPFTDKWGSPKGHRYLPANPRTPVILCSLGCIARVGRFCCNSLKIRKSLQLPISAIIREVSSLTKKGKNMFYLHQLETSLARKERGTGGI